jgi:uncharacterized phiE125 gp8 family phage protein
MRTVQAVAPVLDVISLAEFKSHLRLDSETLAGNLTPYTCLAAGSHAVTTDYTHVGTGVDVLGKEAIVYLRPVNNGASGTADTKIQESDDNATWTDWTGGAFTQVTEANDTVIQEKQYTGSKHYIRTASKVLVAACEFGTDIIVNAATTPVDDDLQDAIEDGTETVENITRRQLLTATWDAFMDEWPDKDYIELPYGNLQSVTSVKYKDTDGTETTLTVTTDYLVETNGEQRGRIVLPYGCSWPSATLYPSNPISIRFVCGWTAAASVPKNIKRAVKLAAEDAFYHGARRELLKDPIDNLLASHRLWSF